MKRTISLVLIPFVILLSIMSMVGCTIFSPEPTPTPTATYTKIPTKTLTLHHLLHYYHRMRLLLAEVAIAMATHKYFMFTEIPATLEARNAKDGFIMEQDVEVPRNSSDE